MQGDLRRATDPRSDDGKPAGRAKLVAASLPVLESAQVV